MSRTIGVAAVALWTVAVQTGLARAETPAASPRLHYDVVDVRAKKVLYTFAGWTETPGEESPEVTAALLLTFPTGGTAEFRARFTRDTPPLCRSWHAVIRDRRGAEVVSATEQVVQDAYPFLLRPLPPNTYPPVAPMTYILPRLGLDDAHPRTSAYFILMNHSLLLLDLWVDGRDTVTVPGGSFDAYRIQMRMNTESVFPNLPAFLRPFVSFFIPTQTMWLSVQEPRMLLKFTGQMGPPGAPQLLIQLTQIEP